MTDQTSSMNITSDEVWEMIGAGKGVVLVDVRTTEEHKEGHLTDDVFLSLNDTTPEKLKQSIGEIAKSDDMVVLYCDSGARSQLACTLLQAQGLNNIKSLDGGILAWRGAGFPVVITE